MSNLHRFPRFGLLALLVCLGLVCNLTRNTGNPTQTPGSDLPPAGQTAQPLASHQPSGTQEAGPVPPETGEPVSGTPQAGALLVVYTKDGDLWRQF